MKHLYAFLVLFLVGCGDDDPAPPENRVPPAAGTIQPYHPAPTPVQVKECTVTKVTPLADCVLYDLLCDDGDTDMVFLCPIRYWDHGPYIPDPAINAKGDSRE